MRLTDRLNPKTLIAGLVLLAVLAIAVPAGYFRLAQSLAETSVPPFLPETRNYLSLSLALLSLLAVGHLTLHRKVLRQRPERLLPIVAGLAGAVFLTYAMLPPTGSADVYWYTASARAWVNHGINPYSVSPIGLADADLLPYLDLKAKHVSPYGPVFSLLAVLPVVLTDRLAGQVIGFKLIGLACYGLAGWLLYRLLRRERRRWAPDFLAGWLFFPWAAYEVALNGHNDAWLTLPLALFAIAVTRRRLLTAVLALTLAALIKPWILILLPTLAVFRGSGRKRWSAAVLAGLVLAALVWLPFADQQPVSSGLLVVSKYVSPYYMGPLMFALAAAANQFVSDPNAAAWAGKLVGLFLAAVGSILSAVLLWRKRVSPNRVIAFQLSLFFLLSFWIHGWYLLAMTPFLALLNGRRLPTAFALIGLAGCLHYLLSWTQLACLMGGAWLFIRFGLKPTLPLLRK